ncbi:cupin domain-containing protein [Roseitranquillus sediminis]|uniref:cupin domain-containing protein n=1 Tax=Roseitranquillus sediminis TaxID=2809051 RepID=UPI001D0C8EFE|nr:cupin domain-containing protein [Roseitranquillus sediminis]MBM9595427.1 cupin domain-containing protein [Roseitranquillus sediminis]
MTRTPAILRPDERPTKDRGNGARTTQLVTRKIGSEAMINGITAFDPGASIGLHFHDCEESVMVIEGTGTVEIDGTRHEMRTGDVTWVPPGVPHRFLNETDAPMAIFWTYASADATRTLVATGETRKVASEEA